MNIYILNVMSCQHEFKVDIKHYVTLSFKKNRYRDYNRFLKHSSKT